MRGGGIKANRNAATSNPVTAPTAIARTGKQQEVASPMPYVSGHNKFRYAVGALLFGAIRAFVYALFRLLARGQLMSTYICARFFDGSLLDEGLTQLRHRPIGAYASHSRAEFHKLQPIGAIQPARDAFQFAETPRRNLPCSVGVAHFEIDRSLANIPAMARVVVDHFCEFRPKLSHHIAFRIKQLT